jgi:hypothetical protein
MCIVHPDILSLAAQVQLSKNKRDDMTNGCGMPHLAREQNEQLKPRKPTPLRLPTLSATSSFQKSVTIIANVGKVRLIDTPCIKHVASAI